MAHTPGTWRTLESPHSKDIAILTSQGLIVEVFHRIDDDSYADVKANAALIAAAPEMFKALEEIAKGEGPFSVDRPTHADNTIENMMSIAEQALAQVGE